MQQIKLSDHFTYRKLFRFTLPSILMMIFTSIYSVVDGFFISNYAGKTAFAAINLIYPAISIIGTLGFMMGTGGAALVASMLGRQERDEANNAFSFLVLTTFVAGAALTVIGFIIVGPVSRLLGATPNMLDDCKIYGRIVLCGMPFFMLQFLFQAFFPAAEKPKLGLFVTLLAGCTNILCDWLFVAVFRWELVGAAAATAFSQFVGGVVPLFYFSRKNSSLLRFVKPRFSGRILLKACTNGSSELMTNISASIVAILLNFQLLKYYGENGVSAYGVIMYVCFIFVAITIGFSSGGASIVSYNYGADNRDELKSLFKKNVTVVCLTSAVMTLAAFLLAPVLANIYVGYDRDLCELTTHALRIVSFSFLLGGINGYSSGFFTALNNGLVSAIISFMRTFVFQIAAVMLLPLIIGQEGIWWAMVVCDVLALAVSIFFLVKNRRKYGYA